MSLSLGEKLRRAREERGISISEVAEQTRISPLYLKSIENDDYKPLPGGIFNKGFVRSYARYIGFDENEALSDYARLMAETDQATEVDQTIHHAEIWTDDRTARSTAPTIIFAIIILAMLAGGIALLVRYFSGPPTPDSLTANTLSTLGNTTSSNTSESNLAAAATPVGAFTVDLKADGERVWIGYSVDGDKTDKTLDAGESVRLNIQDSLKLTFAKVKAKSLEIAVNGKRINVLGGGAKGNFDFDITKNNVAQIVQSGELGTAPPTTQAPTPRPTQSITPKPTTSPSPGGSPKPTPKPGVVPAGSPRATRPPANTDTGRRPPQ